MPQNTPMKRQFTTIDGRTVMSNLPQHWGGNDWTITGVDNPLPVGNYVQTEAGVWIPQKGSDDGAADVRLTGSNVEKNILWGREIRQSFSPSYMSVSPVIGAKGFVLTLIVHGITGTFGPDEGYRLRFSKTVYESRFTDFHNSEWSTSVGNRSGSIITVYPGLSERTDGMNGMLLNLNDLPYPSIRIQPEIKGTFEDGEGVDCEVVIQWLL